MIHTKRFSIIFLIVIIISAFESCSTKNKKETVHEVPNKHSSMLEISDQERLLANIKIDSAKVKSISEITTLVGKTVVDERKVEILTSRVKGRLDKLFIKSTGEYIKKGQVIYSVYSEELLADENDFLLAIEQNRMAVSQKEISGQMLDAARKKLLLWTLTPTQIKALEVSKKATSLIKFYAQNNGYVVELPVREGEYIEIGSPIIKIADFGSLWIETQIYSNEVQYLTQDPKIQIEFEAFPNEFIQARIVFDNPTLEEDQKINLVRLEVLNNEKKFRPGMMAYISLKRNEKKALVIPKTALLMESVISVWVENKDGMFEQRMVTVGIENKDEV